MDVRQWNLPQLLQQEVYLLDQRLYAEFLFAPDTDFSQLDRARSFCLTTFVLGEVQILGEYPYSQLVLDKQRGATGSADWQAFTCRIYSDGKLLYEDIHDKLYF